VFLCCYVRGPLCTGRWSVGLRSRKSKSGWTMHIQNVDEKWREQGKEAGRQVDREAGRQGRV